MGHIGMAGRIWGTHELCRAEPDPGTESRPQSTNSAGQNSSIEYQTYIVVDLLRGPAPGEP
jgi:hypothetical protein